MSEYDTFSSEAWEPMPLMNVLEKVRKGCLCHMYSLDEEGQCAESDEYVVALAFFEDSRTSSFEEFSLPISRLFFIVSLNKIDS